MVHERGQLLRFRLQRRIQLREAFPVSDHIRRVDRVAAQHADDPALHPDRESLPLLRYFLQTSAAGGFFLDQFRRRLAARQSQGLAAGLALENGIFQSGCAGL